MLGVMVEDFRDRSKRLVELRRHLHKVASHTGTAELVVLTVRQHAMKGVTELMEHRGYLVPGEQRGLTLWGLGIIAYIKDNRQLLTLTTLFLKSIHPRTTAFGGTTEVIAIEERLLLAILVDDFKHAHVRMIGRNIGTLLESQAIHAMSGIEDTVYQYAVDIEVGLDLIVRNIQQLLLHLSRIVEAVVRL